MDNHRAHLIFSLLLGTTVFCSLLSKVWKQLSHIFGLILVVYCRRAISIAVTPSWEEREVCVFYIILKELQLLEKPLISFNLLITFVIKMSFRASVKYDIAPMAVFRYLKAALVYSLRHFVLAEPSQLFLIWLIFQILYKSS